MNLAHKKCVPCEGGILPIEGSGIQAYLEQLKTEWKVADGKKITREFVFKDFALAIAFVNNVAEIAESEGHHPDLFIRFNKVNVETTTHAINGLSENDFILAAKIEKLYTRVSG